MGNLCSSLLLEVLFFLMLLPVFPASCMQSSQLNRSLSTPLIYYIKATEVVRCREECLCSVCVINSSASNICYVNGSIENSPLFFLLRKERIDRDQRPTTTTTVHHNISMASSTPINQVPLRLVQVVFDQIIYKEISHMIG